MSYFPINDSVGEITQFYTLKLPTLITCIIKTANFKLSPFTMK